MRDGRVTRLAALLERALAESPERRAAFVARAAGDDAALRRELASLLAAHESSSEYFDDLAAAVVSPAYAAVLDTADAAWVGRRLGAWRLVREVGRGGMSRVFLAERADGAFERQAAIKLLRPDLDAEIDVARFRAERRILASLDHPNIARLLDAGVTDDALPYFVLELVDGVPIDQYCAQRGLPLRQRLSLFLVVADAVEHAHRRAVMHRDIKPSNILVTPVGVPKLLDFGVAKLMEEGVAAASGTTRTTIRWMTPGYAAPEQVRGERSTLRTDVYQLGVLMYVLLAGRAPFDRYAASRQALQAAVLLGEREPLGAAVPRDLDAIVSRAMRSDPAERYASARELADDVRRHLAGQPVTARRQTHGDRVRRFVGRHRGRVAVAAVAVAALSASVGAIGVERALVRRSIAAAGSADTVPPFLRALLAIDPVAARADSARLEEFLRRATTAARDGAWRARDRARAFEVAAEIRLALGEPDSAFALLQEALVVRRAVSAATDGAPSAGLVGASATGRATAPPGRELVFVRPPGIVYVAAADGTREARVTAEGHLHDDAAWAPDGRRMLVSSQSEPRGIHLVDLDDASLTRVTAPPPGWSDHMPVTLGVGVAFTRIDERGGRSFLYRVGVDGTGLRRLTSDDDDGDAAPFPGDEHLAFIRGNDIHVVDLRTGEETRLTRTPARPKAGVSVSPDGRRIAFTRTDPDRLEQIFVTNADGTGTRRVSRGDHHDFRPRWSPDGARLAFTSVRDGTNGVYTMRADGSDVRDVSRTPLSLTLRPGRTVPQVNETLWAWGRR